MGPEVELTPFVQTSASTTDQARGARGKAIVSSVVHHVVKQMNGRHEARRWWFEVTRPLTARELRPFATKRFRGLNQVCNVQSHQGDTALFGEKQGKL